MFINEECGNLIVAHDGGELTKNINYKKKSDFLQYPIDAHTVTNVVGESVYSVTIWNIYFDAHSVTNVVGESICSVTIWNIYFESGMYDFSCEFFH